MTTTSGPAGRHPDRFPPSFDDEEVLTVGALRSRLEGLDDRRPVFVYVGRRGVTLQAEVTPELRGLGLDDGRDSVVRIIAAPVELTGGGTAR